ncbi:MAG TPA: zinc-binding alcohol dehydrogenase, partial [Candidatus Ozemobacteraceae bacterium]|nr:zinc-binding alcohol dehydrogenase [Candidatus Ozemobacteraceae bacterium]
MRQILQNLKNGEIEIADIPVPVVKAGHVLIQSSRSLISVGTERMLLDFGRAGWIDKARQQPDKVRQVFQKIRTDGLLATAESVMRKLDQPLPLGYSNAGRVIAVGKGVTAFAAGDRVVSNGNHADVVCVPENLCAPIPEGVDDNAASFTVLASIALEGVRLVQPTLGERIAVIGLGLIGLLTVQILRANGCRVIGFDFDPAKVA